MKTSTEDLAELVCKIADSQCFTPHGLADYCRDILENPEFYGPGFRPDFLPDGVELTDITRQVASRATALHRRRWHARIESWQQEADAKGRNVAYVLDGDSEFGHDAVLERRRAKRSKELIYGHRPLTVVRWMGSEGWDYRQAKAVLKSFGFELEKADVLEALRDGDQGGTPVDLTDDQANELYRLLD